ncbi:hypothetical protein KAI04_02930 [Candidatus Pacearchaeota archaeon]|nr:hypothetical protein [Candidatus Pacearchaeota archaeon]
MIEEHKVKDKIKISIFLKKIKEYGYENIEATAHTFFRLSQKQREVYTEEVLKKIIFNEKPLEVSIQKNNNYAVIYLYKENKLLKILLDLTLNKVYIVSFYILNREQMKEIGK